MLGMHPSDDRVRAYFSASIVVNAAVAVMLPAGWPRQTFQYATIIYEMSVILHNKRMGIHCSF
jgi:hypothetical protein